MTMQGRLERMIKDHDQLVRDLRFAALGAGSLEDKLRMQRLVSQFEKQRSQTRKQLFEVEDAQGFRDAYVNSDAYCGECGR